MHRNLPFRCLSQNQLGWGNGRYSSPVALVLLLEGSWQDFPIVAENKS